jgi:hypothetical protein
MFLGSRARLVRRADNLTTICEPVLWTVWDPQHLMTQYAPMASYGDSLTFCYNALNVCTLGNMLYMSKPTENMNIAWNVVGHLLRIILCC